MAKHKKKVTQKSGIPDPVIVQPKKRGRPKKQIPTIIDLQKGLEEIIISNPVIVEKKEKVKIPITLIRTVNMEVSKKLQDNKINVIAITGCGIEQPTTHYFNCTIDKAKEVLFAEEIVFVEEAKEIIKTKFIYTDLEEKLKEGYKKEDLKGEEDE